MNFDIAVALGSIAALFSTISFALWLSYGLVLQQWPLIASNGICLVMSAFILGMKLLPRPAKEVVADRLDPSAKH